MTDVVQSMLTRGWRINKYYDVITFYYGEAISNEDLNKQLESLLSEVRQLSSSVVRLRHDDYRMVFGEQIRTILLERLERHFSNRHMADIDGSDAGSELKGRLADAIAMVVDSYQRDGTEAASLLLDQLGGPLGRIPMAPGDRNFVSELLEQIRDYFVTSNHLSRQVDVPPRHNSLLKGRDRNLSPELVESTLGPLANARRIDLLLRLSEGSDSLAGLSKRTGLQKGHLQFHLRVLLKAALVHYDKKGHLYSLTSQGATALDEVSRLIDRLAPAGLGATQ